MDLPMIGQGATASIYRDGDTAIKLYQNPSPNEVENEAARQGFAYQAGLPVPQVYGVRHIDDSLVALGMRYVDGEPLMRPDMPMEQVSSCMETLIDLQCQIHRVDATGQPRLCDQLRDRLQRCGAIVEKDRERLLRHLDTLESNASSLCHGDYHPLNVLYDGRQHWIIDWVDATSGDPRADFCRSYLLLSQYNQELGEIYLNQAVRMVNIPPEDILIWYPMLLAARLTEDMDDASTRWLKATLREQMDRV